MKPYLFTFRAGLIFLTALVFSVTALAQPTLVSTTPTTGASGVATNTAVVFQFSERMNMAPPETGLATNATYHFERTVDFTNWTSLSSIVPSSTTAQTSTDANPTNKAAFYRFRRE